MVSLGYNLFFGFIGVIGVILLLCLAGWLLFMIVGLYYLVLWVWPIRLVKFLLKAGRTAYRLTRTHSWASIRQGP